MSFPEFVERRIVRPLGLDGLYIGGADAQMDRLTDLVGLPALRRHGAAPLPSGYTVPSWIPRGPLRSLLRRGLTPSHVTELFTHPDFWRACLPAMNGVCTARSLAKMYAALSLGGEIDGTRLVREEIVKQSSVVQMKRPDRVVLYPLHWALRGTVAQRLSVFADRTDEDGEDNRRGLRVPRPLPRGLSHASARPDHRASASALGATSATRCVTDHLHGADYRRPVAKQALVDGDSGLRARDLPSFGLTAQLPR